MRQQKSHKNRHQESGKKPTRLRITKLADADTLGKRLNFYRLAKGFSAGDVCTKTQIGMGESDISKYEHDTQRPRGDRLQALAKLYDVTVEQLTIGNAQAKTNSSTMASNIGSQQIPSPRTPPISHDVGSGIIIFQKRDEAYEHFSELLSERTAKIDLLQFSGQTALPVLRAIASTCPAAEIRLLLYDPNLAWSFDSDHNPDHRARIIATTDAIALLRTNNGNGLKLKISHYRTVPSVSSIIVDESLVSLSWYYCYGVPGTKIVRMRGHESIAIIADTRAPSILREFARMQFDLVLESAVVVSTATKGTKRRRRD